ncbi:hypothetical protein BC937DRAFT_89917 [Endogone sp. FLAS-F59071]|nr:hypothetical protein BC937DRAFT_89917 [Endogone sp. FLAS-F59071]|eukprot:RUS17489.1 hypothetical protein BC937DRAFT_89917 [Endogone sp. FLAS-F59071]
MVLRHQRKIFVAGGRIRLEDSDDEGYNEGESLFESTRRTATLVFSDVSYNVAGKPVLASVSGLVQPGEMLAIMGPSGAGKSSFLDILARKPKRGTVTGSVLINNAIPARRQFKKLAGYVDQEDVLMGTLTVRETLMYSALLRLPRDMPLKVKQRRVEETLSELGIQHIADMPIGVPGRRGISGGEKRRVSIGKELVTSPSILFLDEPTSGLDSYNAYVVMECLKKLARVHKRTVVVTIHQPRSNIFKMFDSLLLLAEGRTVYFGPAQQATHYFASIGYPIPPEYNIADYLIDLTMNKPNTSSPSEPEPPTSSFSVPFLSRRSNSTASIASTRVLEDLAATSPTLPTAHAPANLLQQAIADIAGVPDQQDELTMLTSSNHSHTLIEGYRNSEAAESVRAAIRHTVGGEPLNVPPPTSSRFGSSFGGAFADRADGSLSLPAFLHEFSLLASRTFTNLYRNPFLFLAHCVIALGLGLLLGSLFWQVDNDLPGVQNRLGVLFFMCALLGFASTSALDIFAQERVLFMRERENGYYGPAAYFWSKVLFDILPLRVIPPLLMGSVSYYMVGLNPNLIVFLKFLLVLVLFNLVAAGVCLCFATAFKSVGAGNLLASLIMLFAMLFGGFLLNKEHIPIFLRWIQYLSFFNYGYEALIVNELKDMTLRDDSIVDIQIPGSVILSRFGFNGQAFWQDVRALGIMFVGTMVLAFTFLKVLVRERR